MVFSKEIARLRKTVDDTIKVVNRAMKALGCIYIPKKGYEGIIGPKKDPHTNRRISILFGDARGEFNAERYAKFVTQLLGERDNGKLIKELKELSKHRDWDGNEMYGWGTFHYAYDIELPTEDTPTADSFKLNLWTSLAATFLAKHYGLPLSDAQHIVYRTLSKVINNGKTREEALPHPGNKDRVIDALKTVQRDYPVIPEEHIPKLAEAMITLWEEIDKGLPSNKSIEKELHDYLRRKDKNKTLDEIDPVHVIEWIWEKTPEELSKDVIKIKQIAQELEQISPFKEKKPAPKPFSAPDAKLEVLSILNGLEFAGFSEEAKKRALEMLSRKIAELSAEKPTAERIFELGLYAFAAEMIKAGTPERIREIQEL